MQEVTHKDSGTKMHKCLVGTLLQKNIKVMENNCLKMLCACFLLQISNHPFLFLLENSVQIAFLFFNMMIVDFFISRV